jgi:predicted CXXCH cytochrome family protein
LKGKVRFTERDVVFDHKPHLEQVRHGIKLACTSCHSQLVIGSHIRATSSTCALCHFKGGIKRGVRESPIGGCGVCHAAPDKPVKVGDWTVSHKEFVERGIECTRCHVDVTYGDGEATKDRCFHCHNQLEKVERFGETEFIHINHVTVHKVDCNRCHNEIIHKFNTQIAETQHNICESCHEQTHFPQSSLYAGKGARGVRGQPDPMYLLGISCSGCHTVPKHDPETAVIKGQTFTSGNLPCVSCHQDKYTKFVETFNSEFDVLISYLEERYNNMVLRKDDRLAKLLEPVRYNLDFLKSAKGIHNPFYSMEILKACDANLTESERLTGVEIERQKPAGLTDNNCMVCHITIEFPETTGLKDGRKFSHKVHLEVVQECRNCHSEGPHPPGVNMDKVCSNCH